MNKLFKPRCLRRIFLCLAMLFPIVYLCGGLFFALAGAHGEQMFAEPVYVQDYVDINNISGNGNYKLHVTGSFENYLKNDFTNQNIYFDYTYNNNEYTYVRIFNYDNVRYIGTERLATYNFFADYNIVTDTYYQYQYYDFYGDETLNTFTYFLDNYSISYNLQKLVNVPTEVISENNSAYTDFIFSQPFAKDNFITTLGKDLINGSTKGFNPMNELFRTINTNIMHFEDTDGLAMFGLGYVYYAVNVLIIYEILVLAVKLIILPLRAVDVFDKEDI